MRLRSMIECLAAGRSKGLSLTWFQSAAVVLREVMLHALQ